MFADDTTVYCISDKAEKSIAKLNSALRELNEWCLITCYLLPVTLIDLISKKRPQTIQPGLALL